MCSYCMLLEWGMDCSYVGLLVWSYRHRSHVSERVQRECRDSKYGKGVGEIVTIVSLIYYSCTIAFGCYWCSVFLEQFLRFHCLVYMFQIPMYVI